MMTPGEGGDDAALADALERLTASGGSDTGAWEALYRRLAPSVRRLIARWTSGDHAKTEDLLQEVFFRLHRYHAFRSRRIPREFRAYVAKIARRVAIDAAKRKVQTVELADDPTDRGAGVAADVEARDLIGVLLGLLTEDERALATLLEENRSLDEIARALGISYQAAGVRVFRLRRKVRKLADARGWFADADFGSDAE